MFVFEKDLGEVKGYTVIFPAVSVGNVGTCCRPGLKKPRNAGLMNFRWMRYLQTILAIPSSYLQKYVNGLQKLTAYIASCWK